MPHNDKSLGDGHFSNFILKYTNEQQPISFRFRRIRSTPKYSFVKRLFWYPIYIITLIIGSIIFIPFGGRESVENFTKSIMDACE